MNEPPELTDSLSQDCPGFPQLTAQDFESQLIRIKGNYLQCAKQVKALQALHD